jgi:hypothetical protein
MPAHVQGVEMLLLVASELKKAEKKNNLTCFHRKELRSGIITCCFE